MVYRKERELITSFVWRFSTSIAYAIGIENLNILSRKRDRDCNLSFVWLEKKIIEEKLSIRAK